MEFNEAHLPTAVFKLLAARDAFEAEVRYLTRLPRNEATLQKDLAGAREKFNARVKWAITYATSK